MVASVDGAATAQGRSGGLSGDADRQVFSVLRSLADVILAGAGTVRAEKYRPVTGTEAWPELREDRPPTPPIAVVTRLLDLDLESPLLAGAPHWARTIVLTTEAAPAGRRAAAARHADVVIAGAELLSPEAVIGALAERGHQRILIEGGPHLLGQVAAAGLLDELCLTVSPLLAGGRAGRILAAGATGGDDIPAAQAALEPGARARRQRLPALPVPARGRRLGRSSDAAARAAQGARRAVRRPCGAGRVPRRGSPRRRCRCAVP